MPAPERVLFEGDLVTIGEFICPPQHAAFPGGRVDSYLIAFPRTAVRIEREKLRPVVADATTAVTYQPDTTYERYEIDARGDWCNFFAMADVTASEASGEDFWRARAAIPPRAYLEQRRIVDLVSSGDFDPLEIEERAVDVVRAVAANPRGGGRYASQQRRSRGVGGRCLALSGGELPNQDRSCGDRACRRLFAFPPSQDLSIRYRFHTASPPASSSVASRARRPARSVRRHRHGGGGTRLSPATRT